MLVVAFVLTLNNFFYAVNPAAAKPIFDWIDPSQSSPSYSFSWRKSSVRCAVKPNGLGS